MRGSFFLKTVPHSRTRRSSFIRSIYVPFHLCDHTDRPFCGDALLFSASNGCTKFDKMKKCSRNALFTVELHKRLLPFLSTAVGFAP